MKNQIVLWKLMCALALLMSASAVRAIGAESLANSDHFKGWYEILEESHTETKVLDSNYFLYDVDTLEVIWARYAQTPLPEDLREYRLERTILTGFTNREFITMTFEANALVSGRYVRINASPDSVEILRNDGGDYEMATYQQIEEDRGILSRYKLSAPVEGALKSISHKKIVFALEKR